MVEGGGVLLTVPLLQLDFSGGEAGVGGRWGGGQISSQLSSNHGLMMTPFFSSLSSSFFQVEGKQNTAERGSSSSSSSFPPVAWCTVTRACPPPREWTRSGGQEAVTPRRFHDDGGFQVKTEKDADFFMDL